MQPTTLLALFASTAITSVVAACYNNNDLAWAPDQVQANNELGNICNELSGGFSGSQTKYKCINAGSANKKLEFWVKNEAGFNANLGHGDCVLRLSNEVNGCSHGGENSVSGWYFRADPNGGRC